MHESGFVQRGIFQLRETERKERNVGLYFNHS